ncbi:hypothetical protein H0X09_03280 [Candidatus Saccharibacteria bacterium]|nr:hypothetical protein [Candidatus Saccharibacteria bacterium]
MQGTRCFFVTSILAISSVLAVLGLAPTAQAKSSVTTRIAKVEKQIEKLEKQQHKHQSVVRFFSNKERRWMLYPNQQAKPCWKVNPRGPLKLCTVARGAVRAHVRQLASVQAKIEHLKSLLLDTGNEANWSCIHRYERHPRQGWATRTGNGYYGGLQMDISFQSTYGPHVLGYPDSETMFRKKGTANKWSSREQMAVAEYARQSGRGYYPWPNSARTCGLI